MRDSEQAGQLAKPAGWKAKAGVLHPHSFPDSEGVGVH